MLGIIFLLCACGENTGTEKVEEPDVTINEETGLNRTATYITEEELEKREKEMEEEREEARKAFLENPNPKPKVEPFIGMTDDEARKSTWGKPKNINRTTTAYGISEQWVYDGYKYLYFEDGILTTIQD